jgi:hypothetical protein
MKSTRLTNDIRGNICAGMIKKMFSSETEKLKKEMGELGNCLVDEYLGMHKDFIEELPLGILDEGIDYFSIKWEECHLYINLPVKRFVPYGLWHNNKPAQNSAVAPRILACAKRIGSHDQRVNKMRSQIRGILSTANTTKKLKEIFPEAMDFLPKWMLDEAVKPAPLPAVQMDEIRALLK